MLRLKVEEFVIEAGVIAKQLDELDDRLNRVNMERAAMISAVTGLEKQKEVWDNHIVSWNSAIRSSKQQLHQAEEELQALDVLHPL